MLIQSELSTKAVRRMTTRKIFFFCSNRESAGGHRAGERSWSLSRPISEKTGILRIYAHFGIFAYFECRAEVLMCQRKPEILRRGVNKRTNREHVEMAQLVVKLHWGNPCKNCISEVYALEHYYIPLCRITHKTEKLSPIF